MAQLLMKILVSLATEKLFRELMANGLELVKSHTATDVDDKLLEPVIKALRGE